MPAGASTLWSIVIQYEGSHWYPELRLYKIWGDENEYSCAKPIVAQLESKPKVGYMLLAKLADILTLISDFSRDNKARDAHY